MPGFLDEYAVEGVRHIDGLANWLVPAVSQFLTDWAYTLRWSDIFHRIVPTLVREVQSLSPRAVHATKLAASTTFRAVVGMVVFWLVSGVLGR